MLIEFKIWGEYDELTIKKTDGRPPTTIGLIRVKLNNLIIHEEECHLYLSPNDQESAILAAVKTVFAKLGG